MLVRKQTAQEIAEAVIAEKAPTFSEKRKLLRHFSYNTRVAAGVEDAIRRRLSALVGAEITLAQVKESLVRTLQRSMED